MLGEQIQTSICKPSNSFFCHHGRKTTGERSWMGGKVGNNLPACTHCFLILSNIRVSLWRQLLLLGMFEVILLCFSPGFGTSAQSGQEIRHDITCSQQRQKQVISCIFLPFLELCRSCYYSLWTNIYEVNDDKNPHLHLGYHDTCSRVSLYMRYEELVVSVWISLQNNLVPNKNKARQGCQSCHLNCLPINQTQYK